jgi:hypothetical protein
MASAKAAAHASAATESGAAAEPAHVSAAEPAHVSAAEPAAHVSATTDPPAVSTPTTVSTPASPAARERVSGQSPGESGSRRQNDHGLA